MPPKSAAIRWTGLQQGVLRSIRSAPTFEHICRPSGGVTGKTEFIVTGSQATPGVKIFQTAY